MKPLFKAIAALIILTNLISCTKKDYQPSEILGKLAEHYKDQESIQYKVFFKQKFFDSNDTIAITADCNIYRVSTDTIFGGYLSFKTSDGMNRVYDLNNIYVADSTQNIATIFKAKEGQDFGISGNYTVAVLNEYFLDPELLLKESADPAIKKSIALEKKNDKDCYKLTLEYPDEEGFSGIKQLIWIDEDANEIIAMSSTAIYQGNTQYKEWLIDNVTYNKVKPSDFQKEKSNITGAYKTANYKEPDASYFMLLANGTVAPDFNGINVLTKERVTLSALRGKIVLLDFFYMSCAPCIKTIPELLKLQAKFGDKLVVLGINSKDNNDEQKLKLPSFIESNKIGYQVLLTDKEVDKKFNVNVYPSLYAIGKDGKIIHSHLGYNENLYNDLNKIISGNLR